MGDSMPSLVRFLTILVVVAACVYAAMFALATLVEPRQTEMSEPIELNVPETPDPPETRPETPP